MKKRDGTRVAQWVSARIAEITPPGIGHWGPAWELVEEPSNLFLDALRQWELTGSEEDMRATQEAGGVVIAAWREAAANYREAMNRHPSPEVIA